MTVTPSRCIRYREAGDDMRGAFVDRGYRSRSFFPHRTYFIPTCGPDALTLSGAMCESDDPEKLWVIGLHAANSVVRDLPAELFFDPELVWHQEHYGLAGHVAFAMAVLDGNRLHVLNCVSDLVQRQSRRPEFSTRIDRFFRGWPYMLFNALLVFARERGIGFVHTPVADFVMRHTDRSRTVDPALFVRVYDRAPARYAPVRRGDWWVIDVAANANRTVIPRAQSTAADPGRTICLCHDIERSLGHADVDPLFAAEAEHTSAGALDRMLAIEREAGVRGTYNVVGCLLGEVRPAIEAGGHCLGFHSYDHSIRGFSPVVWARVSRRLRGRGRFLRRLLRRLRSFGSPRSSPATPPGAGRHAMDQPALCRQVDRRIRGYRPPQSKITYEVNDFNLALRNYRWLASSPRSLGLRVPTVENRVVKIPIALDDFPIHTRQLTYAAWKRRVLTLAESAPFAAISLHDCYADQWLHDYPDFLAELATRGRLRTLDEVAWDSILGDCV
jgi:peptidoglycan/xylan/chitin deacetylase (PgdA/CDA1 family)